FHVDRLGQRDHGGLGRVVARAGERARVTAGPGRDVDDQPVLALAHAGQYRLHAVEHPGQVDRHDLVPAVDRDVLETALRVVDAGAVDQDVDAAVALGDLGAGPRHLVLVCDVERNGLAASSRLDL